MSVQIKSLDKSSLDKSKRKKNKKNTRFPCNNKPHPTLVLETLSQPMIIRLIVDYIFNNWSPKYTNTFYKTIILTCKRWYNHQFEWIECTTAYNATYTPEQFQPFIHSIIEYDICHDKVVRWMKYINLKKLVMYNAIDAIRDYPISILKNLNTLIICNSPLIDVSLYNGIRKVKLISCIGVRNLSNVQNIEYLSLHGSRLTTLGLPTKIPMIKYLNLSNTNIISIDISGVHNIYSLDLSGTNISEIPVPITAHELILGGCQCLGNFVYRHMDKIKVCRLMLPNWKTITNKVCTCSD